MAAIPRALILDQDSPRSTKLRTALGSAFDVIEAENFRMAYAAMVAGQVDVALVAYNLGDDGSGLEFLLGLPLFAPNTFRILYSKYYCAGLARDATRNARAHAVFDANRDDFEVELRATILRLLATRESQPTELGAVPGKSASPPWCPVSNSTREFLSELRSAAHSWSPVFLWGEAGSGKRLAASTLRDWRKRWAARSDATASASREAGRTVILRTPPLRERILDLPQLARNVLVHPPRPGRKVRPFAPDALAALMLRAWRGNVRELQAVVSRADGVASATRSPAIGVHHLPAEVSPTRRLYEAAKDEGQRQTILHELQEVGSVRAAARLEGSDRSNYARLMRRLGVLRAD